APGRYHGASSRPKHAMCLRKALDAVREEDHAEVTEHPVKGSIRQPEALPIHDVCNDIRMTGTSAVALQDLDHLGRKVDGHYLGDLGRHLQGQHARTSGEVEDLMGGRDLGEPYAFAR